MKSMTGYAKVNIPFGDSKLSVEIKTLNSKQLDLIVKLPSFLRHRELDVRSLLSQLERGKVELLISEESAPSTSSFNPQLLRDRVLAVRQTLSDLSIPLDQSLGQIIAMPDIWNSSSEVVLSDPQWDSIALGIQDAINQVAVFRNDEGSVLELDFHKHVDLIEKYLLSIPEFETERIDTARDRIMRFMTDSNIKEVDPNRFEQELIYYLEKLDITEEKVRLQKHIDYFRSTLAKESTCGKKLGFVAQEMGREINTIGSKANHVEIQKLVVMMKDELEKIKEQLGNVL